MLAVCPANPASKCCCLDSSRPRVPNAARRFNERVDNTAAPSTEDALVPRLPQHHC